MEEFIKIGSTSQIIMESEKAICMPVGRTFGGEAITTWYPKSIVFKRRTRDGVFLFAPEWVKRNRRCTIGDPTPVIPVGMEPFEETI